MLPSMAFCGTAVRIEEKQAVSRLEVLERDLQDESGLPKPGFAQDVEAASAFNIAKKDRFLALCITS
jgi:hypothetical protein